MFRQFARQFVLPIDEEEYGELIGLYRRGKTKSTRR